MFLNCLMKYGSYTIMRNIVWCSYHVLFMQITISKPVWHSAFFFPCVSLSNLVYISARVKGGGVLKIESIVVARSLESEILKWKNKEN